MSVSLWMILCLFVFSKICCCGWICCIDLCLGGGVCLDTLCVYMLLTWCQPNIFVLLLQLYYEQCYITAGQSKLLVIWQNPAEMIVLTPAIMDTLPPLQTQRRRWCRPRHRQMERQPAALVPTSTGPYASPTLMSLSSRPDGTPNRHWYLNM